ncbi:MAG: hypothetical protein WHV67_02370 [Thermoanaerobaculia bacterium]
MKKLLFLFLLMMAGILLSSNMGFKATMTFAPGGSNAWWVSIPYYYFPQDVDSSGTVNSADVCADATNLAGIFAWDSATGTPIGYTCGGIEDPFDIQKGRSYQFVGDGSATITWISVGSHDPTYQHSYPAGGSNAWWVSIPYHWNPVDIDSSGTKNSPDLCNEVTNLAGVFAWDPATGTPIGYTCGGIEDPFDINVFNGYQFVGDGSATITWTPSHY